MVKRVKKCFYELAEVQIIRFCVSDVIVTSGTDQNGNSDGIEDSLPDDTWQS